MSEAAVWANKALPLPVYAESCKLPGVYMDIPWYIQQCREKRKAPDIDAYVHQCKIQEEPISIKVLVGGGYDDYWNTRKFFRVCKGAKGSKKSKTTAYWYIYHMMRYSSANLLVVRRYFADIHDSCFTDLLWAIDHLGVSHLWKATNIPLQLTYTPTGQVILFRGLDDASKLASITVRKGILCWMWIEEAYQVADELEFEKLQMSLRGAVPEGSGLFKQITLTFNPWSEHTWLKPRFFDGPSEPEARVKWEAQVFSKTTTYKCNEWLDETDLARYDELRVRNPARARIVCDGEWGVSEGLIYENWEEKAFDIKEILSMPNIETTFGLDFGYAVSFNAFLAIAVDTYNRVMWIWDEMYNHELTNIQIVQEIIRMGYGKEEIIADSQERKSIREIRDGFDVKGEHISLPRIRKATKGNDSVSNGIQRIQAYKIFVHPKCVNTIIEFNNYVYDTDSEGKQKDEPKKEFDHAMDAMRYAMEKFFVRGKGRVAVAKGVDTGKFYKEADFRLARTLNVPEPEAPAEPDAPAKRKVRRVAST